MTKDQSIALVVLDTLRKDHFDKHFNWLPGRRYENTWSSSHWTVPAHATLLTGERPSEVGVHGYNLHYPDVETLPGVWDGETYVYSANPNISPTFGATKDFDHVIMDDGIAMKGENVVDWDRFIHENRDRGPMRFVNALRECFSRNMNTVESLRTGFEIKMKDSGFTTNGTECFTEKVRETDHNEDSFALFNLMEAHAPYDPPTEYGAPDVDMKGVEYTFGDSPDNRSEIEDAYDASVRYLSDLYQDLFDKLIGEFDTVITISDHGEMLGEEDIWEHLIGINSELVHIPCVVSGDSIPLSDNLTSLPMIHHAILGDRVQDNEIPIEFHGIPKRNREAAESVGITFPDEIDQARLGVVTKDGYTFETWQGEKRGDGNLDEEFRFHLDDGNTSVNEDVQDRLEDLGYA